MPKIKSSIPDSWTWTTIGDAFEVILGQSPPSDTYNEEGIGLAFFQGKAEFGGKYPTVKKWCSEPKKVAEKDDILLSVRAPVGPTNINPQKSCIGRGLAAIRGLEGISPPFILYLLRAYENELKKETTGTTFAAITGKRLKEIDIPLPPLDEQVRIVGRVEELFSQLDAAVRSLQTAQTQLEQYRQTTLKQAYIGKLTEKWRNEHNNFPNSVEEIDIEQFSNLVTWDTPKEWRWVSVGSLVESMQNGIYKPAEFYSEDGVACLRMYNIEDGKIIWKDIKRMILTEEEYDKFLLKSNDILINRVNSRELVGKSAVIPDNLEPSVYESKNIRMRINKKQALSQYIQNWLHYFSSRYFNINAQQVVGMASINQTQIANMPIPITSIEEQNEIVQSLNSVYSYVDKINETIIVSLEKSKFLKNSILKKAFEGNLVPQDPRDEPASVLLERIKAQKTKQRKLI